MRPCKNIYSRVLTHDPLIYVTSPTFHFICAWYLELRAANCIFFKRSRKDISKETNWENCEMAQIRHVFTYRILQVITNSPTCFSLNEIGEGMCGWKKVACSFFHNTFVNVIWMNIRMIKFYIVPMLFFSFVSCSFKQFLNSQRYMQRFSSHKFR